jgi:hypothetical protein
LFLVRLRKWRKLMKFLFTAQTSSWLQVGPFSCKDVHCRQEGSCARYSVQTSSRRALPCEGSSVENCAGNIKSVFRIFWVLIDPKNLQILRTWIYSESVTWKYWVQIILTKSFYINLYLHQNLYFKKITVLHICVLKQIFCLMTVTIPPLQAAPTHVPSIFLFLLCWNLLLIFYF